MAWQFVRSSSQWIDLGSALPTLNNRAAATICAWVRRTSSPASFMALCEIGTGSGSVNDSRIAMSWDNALNRWFGYSKRIDGGVGVSTAGGSGTTAVAKHIACVCRWTGQRLSVYENGVEVSFNTVVAWTANCSATNSQAAAIASEEDGSTLHLDGYLADVRVYSRALSTAELEVIYRARSRDNITFGLEHRWALLQLSPGSTPYKAWDRCANRDGTPQNNPTSQEAFTYYRRRAA